MTKKIDKNMSFNCPNCSNILPNGAKFCSTCGVKIINQSFNYCSCGQELVAKAKFCPKCGKSQISNSPQLQETATSGIETICTCGKLISPHGKFCAACGKDLSTIKNEKTGLEQHDQIPNPIKSDQNISEQTSRNTQPADNEIIQPSPNIIQNSENVSSNQNIQQSNNHDYTTNKQYSATIQNTNSQPSYNNPTNPPASNFQPKAKPVKKIKAGKVFLIIFVILFAITGIGGAYLLLMNGPDVLKPEYNKVEYYPQEGAGGTYVYFAFDNGFDPNTQDVNFYFHSQELPILSFADNTAMIQIPKNSRDGEIEIMSDGKILSKHTFKVLKPEIIKLASETIKPSNQSQTINFPDGVNITIPAGFVKSQTGISISEVKNAPTLAMNPLSPIKEYDIVIDGMEQLPNFIEISLPYDSKLFGKDFPEEDQFLAFRRDNDFNHFTTLAYSVDKDNQRVSIYTDHLSVVGMIVIGGLIIGPAVGMLGPESMDKLSYDIYVTPQKNIRLMYNKELDKKSLFLNEADWMAKYRPAISTLSYSKDHPKFIQDIGEMFEIALENYRKAGLKEAVKKPGWIRKEVINHVNIKLDSYTASLTSEPSYLSHTGYIHMGAELYLIDFRNDESSHSFVGHELFHRVQAEYYNFTRFKRAQDFWWIEAAAEYAGDRVAWKENIRTWNGKQFEKMFKQIPSDLLSHPINTTGKPNTKYQNEYEYHASVFIYYLIEVCGFDFAELIDAVAKGAPLTKLDVYLKSQSGGVNGIEYYYRGFARWAFFAEGKYSAGFFKKYPLADFKSSDNNELCEKKDIITMPENKELLVSVEGNKDICIEVLQLKEGAKSPLNSTPQVLATIYGGQSQKIINIKNDEIVYFMAVNNGGTGASAKVKIGNQVGNKPVEELCEHNFSFKDSYSAKLYALKLKSLEFTMTPDTISDGKINEKYSFKLNAENIPANVTSVYIDYDFGDTQSNSSKDKTQVILVEQGGKIETEISYTWKYATKKCNIKMRLMNAADNKELAKTEGIIEFYNVKILGDRSIVYEISEGSVTEFKQKFTAEATPPGDYQFEWDFDDGIKSLKLKGVRNKSEIEHTYTNLKEGQEFIPKVKLYDAKENLLAEDEINIRVEKKKENKKPDVPVTPPVSNNYRLTFVVYLWTNYTEGHNEDGQTWIKSNYHSFEKSGTWGISISKGGSFSGSTSFKDNWERVSGVRDDKMLKSFKYEKYDVWNRDNKKIREEWMTVELRNVPVYEIGTNDYGIQYKRDGWDCDNLRPDPEFAKSIVKIEHKIKFYPSGKEISIASFDFSKSEVNACKDWQNIWIPKSHIRVGIGYNK
jgi:hypothetical protein